MSNTNSAKYFQIKKLVLSRVIVMKFVVLVRGKDVVAKEFVG